jgi:hypothetical protein
VTKILKRLKSGQSQGSRNTKAKKLKSNIVKEKKPSKWPDLKASVFIIDNIVSTKPSIVEGVWKHDLMSSLTVQLIILNKFYQVL